MVRQLRLGLERGFRWRLLARLQVLGGRVLVIGVGVLLDLGVQHILKQSCRVHYHFDVQLFRCYWNQSIRLTVADSHRGLRLLFFLEGSADSVWCFFPTSLHYYNLQLLARSEANLICHYEWLAYNSGSPEPLGGDCEAFSCSISLRWSFSRIHGCPYHESSSQNESNSKKHHKSPTLPASFLFILFSLSRLWILARFLPDSWFLSNSWSSWGGSFPSFILLLAYGIQVLGVVDIVLDGMDFKLGGLIFIRIDGDLLDVAHIQIITVSTFAHLKIIASRLI